MPIYSPPGTRDRDWYIIARNRIDGREYKSGAPAADQADHEPSSRGTRRRTEARPAWAIQESQWVEMKSGIPPMQVFSGACGIVVVAILDITTPFNFTGYGPDGIDWLTFVFSGFWFGIVGNGGGMLVYWIVCRMKSRS